MDEHSTTPEAMKRWTLLRLSRAVNQSGAQARMNKEQTDRLLAIQEAAGWLVELPFESSEVEAEFRRWIRKSPVNAYEFAAILRLYTSLARLDLSDRMVTNAIGATLEDDATSSPERPN